MHLLEAVEEFLLSLIGEVKESTRNNYGYQLKSLLRDQELKLLNAMRTAEDFRSICIVLFLWSTGCRIEGALSLKMKDLNLSEKRTYVWEKGRGLEENGRWVYFDQIVADELKNYIQFHRSEKRSEGYVFVSQHGGRLTRQAVWYHLKKHSRHLDLEGPVNPHSFRHAFAIMRLQNGDNLAAVQKLLGHANIKTTMQYARFDGDYMAQHHGRCSPLQALDLRNPLLHMTKSKKRYTDGKV